jgi:glycosyltransferase involved in cell wall biosynthesis
MYCGNCLHDNALVAALRRMGHQVLMVPLYLPLTLDEADQSAGTPIFFGGINVYLEQKGAFFRQSPRWLHDLLASRRLLQWVAGKAASTRAADLGELTLSMLRGEDGNQARELDELVAWLETQPRPDVVCLSNALLLGLARRLKKELAVPVVCSLQGEDWFLDSLPEPHRAACWQTLAQRAADVEAFIAPSHYFAHLMQERLGLPAERVRVVYDGINLAGYEDGKGKAESRKQKAESGTISCQLPIAGDQGTGVAPVLGFFARLCREKGLDTLVEAYIALRRRGRVNGLKLRVGGSCGPADEPFVAGVRERLKAAGALGEVEFCPNLDRAGKLAFLRSLSVFSVPAAYGEAFGLYVIEALATGVPVVQPRSGAFPELVAATGGGRLCAPGDVQALAEALEELLVRPAEARALGEAGRQVVFARFSAEAMARAFLEVLRPVMPSTPSVSA